MECCLLVYYRSALSMARKTFKITLSKLNFSCIPNRFFNQQIDKPKRKIENCSSSKFPGRIKERYKLLPASVQKSEAGEEKEAYIKRNLLFFPGLSSSP